MGVKYSYTNVHNPHFLRLISSAAYDKGQRTALERTYLPPLVLQATMTSTTVEVLNDVTCTRPSPVPSWEDELPEYTPMNWCV